MESNASARLPLLLPPVAWFATSLVSHAHPGDEYGLYVVSNVIGMVSLFVLEHLGGIGSSGASAAVAFAGGLLVLGWTLVLRKLATPLLPFLALWLVAAGLTLLGLLADFDDIPQALGKNGSWTAYLSASSNIGLTVALVLAPALRLLRRGQPTRAPEGPSA